MSIGTAVRQARAASGQTQKQLAQHLYISDSLLSAIELGQQKPTRQMRRHLAEALRYPAVYMAVAAEATGGVMSPVYLDGPAADLHRVTTLGRMVEELREVLERLEDARPLILRARSAEGLNPDGQAQIDKLLLEMAEASTGLFVGFAVFCEVYQRSPVEVYRQHREELTAKGYVAKEKSAPKRR